MTGPLTRLLDALAHKAHIEQTLLTPGRVAPLVLERRRALRVETDDAYATLALQNDEEFARLRDLIAVPETWLFRYPASFEILRDTLRARGATALQALSVPCATGAEAYSIAAAALAAGIPHSAVRVLAVDQSADALARARAGTLTRMATREGVPAWAAEWFEVRGDTVHVLPALCGCIEWVQATLPGGLEHLPHHSFDVVFCRNLAIYLGTHARKKIGAWVLQTLAPQGMLFLGHAEPPGILGFTTQFTALEPRASFAFAPRAAACTPAPPSDSHGDTPGAGARAQAPRAPSGRAHARTTRGPRTQPRAHTHAPASPRAAPDKAPVRSRNSAVPAAAAPPGTPAGLDAVRDAANAGHARKALELGRACMAAGDRSTDLLLLMGTAHATLGEYTPAEELLRQVAYLDPRHLEALLQLAALADMRGDGELAARYRARAARTPATDGGRT